MIKINKSEEDGGQWLHQIKYSLYGTMRYTIYSRDTIKVIKDQIADTPVEQIFFACEEVDAIFIP